MKKIALRNVSDILSDKEMKKVTGGYGSGEGTCAARGPEVAGKYQCHGCNLSRQLAEFWGGVDGGNWCCDSCSEATWYSKCC